MNRKLIIISVVALILVLTVILFVTMNKPEPLKVCPEGWIKNRMPRSVGPWWIEIFSKKTPSEYLVYKGSRRELSEFDLDWVKANCNIQPSPVY